MGRLPSASHGERLSGETEAASLPGTLALRPPGLSENVCC